MLYKNSSLPYFYFTVVLHYYLCTTILQASMVLYKVLKCEITAFASALAVE